MSTAATPLGTFPDRDVYTVSRLNLETRDLLAAEFPALWIEGEISNLARPGSGHLYFSLKDERCQVRCAMFRGRNRTLRFAPENGMQVLARAGVSLYPERGEFQLVVEFMEESGEGALRRAFDALKTRLAAEGLFDEERKRPLPKIATRIGIVTSPSGAAVRDVLSVLARRFPSIPVVIYPAPVQGQGAGAEIARVLEVADRRGECDVIILTRGGGSLEDLWAFNEEVLARAIAGCRTPVISGVGHEIDFTIADFVADRRAPTPSAAAELVTPDKVEIAGRLTSLRSRLTGMVASFIRTERLQIYGLAKRLIHPRRYLQNMAQRVDETTTRLERILEHQLSHRRSSLAVVVARFERHRPEAVLDNYRSHTQHLTHRLHTNMMQTLTGNRRQLQALVREFNAVGPQRTLERGYAIVTDTETGKIVRRSGDSARGKKIRARLASGSLDATVDETQD